MCRLMALLADKPMLLADIVLWPQRSIIKQSYDARERKGDPNLPFHLAFGSLNADGFGIGWYSPESRRNKDPTPCTFTSITPAWNNENLARLATKIESPLIFAHVRAAYPGMPVSEQNCHPFMWGRYMWMHNGVVGGFVQIKRGLLADLSDTVYNTIQSFHSDSSVCFGVFLSHLPDLTVQQPPEVLLAAMEATIATITRHQQSLGINSTSILNFMVSDGASLVATRFVSPPTADAASLYYAEGSSFHRTTESHPCATFEKGGNGAGGPQCPLINTVGPNNHENAVSSSILHEASYELGQGERGPRLAFVSSEPITGSASDWVAVPKNTMLIITREKGGFINVLRSPLTMAPLCVGLATPLLAGPLVGLGPPREAVACLEALSRGQGAQSRPWVASRDRPPPATSTPPWQQVAELAGQAVPALQLSRRNSGDDLLTAGLPGQIDAPASGSTTPNGMGAPGGMLQPDLTEEHHFQRLVGHNGPVVCMALDEVNLRLYTASMDRQIKVWSLADNRLLSSVTVGKKPVTVLQLCGRWLYSSAGRKLHVWDTTNISGLVCVDSLRISSNCGNVRCLLATPTKVFLGCQDATVKAFDLDISAWETPGAAGPPTGRRLSEDTYDVGVREADYCTSLAQGHVGPVNALVASASGEYIISAAGDATIRVWRTSDLTLVRTLRGHRGSVLCLLVIENLLVSGARDNTIRVWDLDMDLMCRRTLSGHKDDVIHLAAVTLKRRTHYVNSDSSSEVVGNGRAILPCTVVASTSADGTVRLWSLTWTCLCVLALPAPTGNPQPPHAYEHLNSSQNGTRAANGSPWRGQSKLSTQMEGQQEPPMPVALCSALTHDVVCTGYSDGELRLWYCADVHLAALQLVAADLGIVGPDMTATAASQILMRPGVVRRHNSTIGNNMMSTTEGCSPSGLSPSGLSPSGLSAWPSQHTLPTMLAHSLQARAGVGASPRSPALGPAPEQRSPHRPFNGHANGNGAVNGQGGKEGWQSACASAFLPTVEHPPLVSHALTPGLLSQQMSQQTSQQLSQQTSQRASQQASQRTGQQTSQRTSQQTSQRTGQQTSQLRVKPRTGVAPPNPEILEEWVNPNNGPHSSAPWVGLTETSSAVVVPSASQRIVSTPHNSPAVGVPQASIHGVSSSLVSAGVSGSLGRENIRSSYELERTGLDSMKTLVQGDTGFGSFVRLDAVEQMAGALALARAKRRSFSELGRCSMQGVEDADHLQVCLEVAEGEEPPLPSTGCLESRQSELTSAASSGGSPCGSPGDQSHGQGQGQYGSVGDQGQRQSQYGSIDEKSQGQGQYGSVGDQGQRQSQYGSMDEKSQGQGQYGSVGDQGQRQSQYGSMDEKGQGQGQVGRSSECGSLGDKAVAVFRESQQGPSRVSLPQLALETASALGLSRRGSASQLDPPQQLRVLNQLLDWRLNRPSQGMGLGLGGVNTDMQLESCLREFVRIQTVSSNPRMRDECVKGAKYLAKLLESLGADVKVVRPYDDKNPVVIARLGHDPAKPTVCFYGHYDVQPAQESDWRTDPFELNAVNEYLYGRGTSDNKGPILAFIFAVRELMNGCECNGGRSMPVNIVFCFEGEEENGSIGFREAVTQNLKWFEGTQLIVISNTNWVGESVPCLTYGMRGMISMSVQVGGPKRDVHSGNDGGVFCEPMMDLIKVMSTVMKPGSTAIQIPGFGDQVQSGLIDLAWSSLAAHGPDEFSHEGYQAALGVPALSTPKEDIHALLERRWCAPSLSIVDMRPSMSATSSSLSNERTTCYRFGPTRFSVIPRTAVAKISVRFVPRQDPNHVIRCLSDHVHSEFGLLGSSNSVSVHVDALGNWWEADVASKWMHMAEAAVKREWGCEPLFTREGGTMPVASVLERLLSAPAIMIPLGQSSDRPHLANERIRRVNLIKGKGVIRALLEEVAGLWSPGTPSNDLAAAVRAASGDQVHLSMGDGAGPHLQSLPTPGGACGAVRAQEDDEI